MSKETAIQNFKNLVGNNKSNFIEIAKESLKNTPTFLVCTNPMVIGSGTYILYTKKELLLFAQVIQTPQGDDFEIIQSENVDSDKAISILKRLADWWVSYKHHCKNTKSQL